MRKIILFLGGVLLLLSSCKKQYQCECTFNSGGNAGQVTTLQTQGKLSKRDAQDWCNENEEGIAYADGVCVLK